MLLANENWLLSNFFSTLPNLTVCTHIPPLYRCPSGVSQSKKPNPRVQATKALGGVDQASLRSTLSSSEDPVYLTDSELWIFSETLYRLEETQLSVLESLDIQEIVLDIGLCRKILTTILTEPQIHEHR